ncbi:MAG: catalase [Eubacteriales bacterium]|nr:catalase [Eubacteriales bacterium]
MSNSNPANTQASCAPCNKSRMTLSQGAPVYDSAHSQTLGQGGPVLLQDVSFLEKMAHFDRERIPERVVHAKGSGAFGSFCPYRSMAEYTSAAFLQDPGVSTRFLIRFSTVIGSKGAPDTDRDPRGFAVKFYTSEGNYDVVGLSLPVFFIRDAIKFPDFIHSQKPDPCTNIKNYAHVWDFFSLSPESLHQITWLYSDRGIVKDYARMDGFGVNTFVWVNKEGKRFFVKYHFLGQEPRDIIDRREGRRLAGQDPDIAVRSLHARLASGNPIRYEFSVQIMDPAAAGSLAFDPLDDTKTWPEDQFPLMKVGMLTVNENPSNFFTEIEQSAFCPANIVPGIEFSADRMLQGRTFSYTDTQRYRIGANFAQLPVNRPCSPAANHQQDGDMAYCNPPGNINYKPNSLADNMPQDAPAPSYPGMSYPGGQVVREEIAKTDNFSQPRARYLSLPDAEKARMADAIGWELAQAGKQIQKRQLDLFAQVSADLANRVSREIYLFETGRKM